MAVVANSYNCHRHHLRPHPAGHRAGITVDVGTQLHRPSPSRRMGQGLCHQHREQHRQRPESDNVACHGGDDPEHGSLSSRRRHHARWDQGFCLQLLSNSITVFSIGTSVTYSTTMASVGANPDGIAMTPDETKALVALYGESNVGIIALRLQNPIRHGHEHVTPRTLAIVTNTGHGVCQPPQPASLIDHQYQLECWGGDQRRLHHARRNQDTYPSQADRQRLYPHPDLHHLHDTINSPSAPHRRHRHHAGPISDSSAWGELQVGPYR